MAEIEARMLELAKEALAEQERHVADMRNRGATLLAAGGVVAGLLGNELVDRGHPDGWMEWLCPVVGLGGAVVLVASVVGLFALRPLAFSMDARATYAQCFNAGITAQPLVDLEIADRLARARDENEDAVDQLRAALHRALAALVMLTTALGAGAALAS
jgi:hypothetical protein